MISTINFKRARAPTKHSCSVDTLYRARDMSGAFALSAGSKGANRAKRRK